MCEKGQIGQQVWWWAIIYVRDGLPYKIRDDLNDEDEIEYLWIEVTRSKCKPVLICCVYRAPDTDLTKFISSFNDTSSKISFMNSDVVVLGDFNVDCQPGTAGKGNTLKRKVHSFMCSLDLIQLIKEPTRITDTSKTLIDLIFVFNKHRFIKSGVVLLSISDHSLVYCILEVGVTKVKPRIIEFRSYKSYDRDAFLKDLNNVPWHLVYSEDNVDDAVLTWNKLFLDVADSHAPIKRCRVKGVRSPWMTNAISEGMQNRDYHHRKATKTGSPYNWRMFKIYRNFVNKEMKTSKSNYYIKQIEESKGGASKVWKSINEVVSEKGNSSAPNCIISDEVQYTDVKSIATVMNKHFVKMGGIL